MRATLNSVFRFFTALFSGAAEYAEAFETTGKYVKKSTEHYVSELDDERAKRLAEMNKAAASN